LRGALETGNSSRYSLNNMGEKLAWAAILDEIEARQAGAFLYTHNVGMSNDTASAAADVVEGILRTLTIVGRRELFRPLTQAIHDACWTRWTWNADDRIAWRENQNSDAVEPPDHIPDFDERCDQEHQLASGSHSTPLYNHAFAGEVAWQAFGRALLSSQVFRMQKNGSITPANHLTDLLAMYADVTTTIPDARHWAQELIIAIVRQARVARDFWKTEKNCDSLIAMSKILTDTEACSVMRKLNEFDRINAPSKENAVIEYIVQTHPNFSLNDWLTKGIMHDLKVSGAYKRPQGGSVCLPADQSSAHPNGRSEDEMLASYFDKEGEIRLYDHVFNRVIEQVGLDGTIDISPSLNKILQNMADRHKIDGTEALYQLIRVTLDKTALTAIAGGKEAVGTVEPENSTQDLSHGRSRRI
jgi:hypothetical protein